MLSSGMFARHQPHPSAPARRGGPARPCDSSVFPATSAISVLIPALSPKNPSFVFIRLRTLANSVHLFYSRPLSCPLFSYSCALFCTQEKRNSFIFRRFRTLCAKHGGWGEGVVLVCLTKGFLRGCPGTGPSCFKAPVWLFDSQMLSLAAFRNLLLPPSVSPAKCKSTPAPLGSPIT